MHHSDTQFPARPLFTAVATGMGDHGVTLAGPIGSRAVSACTGGHFAGPRLSGVVVAEHGNDWLLASTTDPALSCHPSISLDHQESNVIQRVSIEFGGLVDGAFGTDCSD